MNNSGLHYDNGAALKRERAPYELAASRILDAAQFHGVDLALAMGFFVSLDWYEIANSKITDEALDVVFREIAGRIDLQERLREERR